MSPVRYVTSQSQQAISVNALIDDPLLLPERTIRALEGQFAMDFVLRNGGNITGGAMQFRVAAGLFAEQTSEVVPELGEIPYATRQRGDLQSVPAKVRALAVLISEQMRIRDAIGEVDAQITTVRNTIVRDVDGEFVKVLRAAVPAGNVRAATAPWSSAAATIRKDINAARLAIQLFEPAGGGQGYSGYSPTDLLISPATATNLANSDELAKMLFGSVNPSADLVAPATGRWGIALSGLRPFVTPGVADNEAFVVQRGTVGAYGDEWPLRSTELYEIRPRMSWRSDTSRSTAGAIDNPGAVARVVGC